MLRTEAEAYQLELADEMIIFVEASDSTYFEVVLHIREEIAETLNPSEHWFTVFASW